MKITEEELIEWIEKEDIKAIKHWLKQTDDVDYVYQYEEYEEYGEDYYFYELRWSRPALYLAVCDQKPQIVKLLLEYGANPNLKTDDDNTALYKAVEKQNIDIVALLLAFGAKPSGTGECGKTPLMCAVNDRLIEPVTKEIKLRIIELLLKSGADPNERVESYPLSPYEIADQRLDREVMALLKKYIQKKHGF